MSTFVGTSVFALNIGTALSLGLAVDYALLLVSRHREETAEDGFTCEAHRRMVATAGRTALFSGLTVAGAMAALMRDAAALPVLGRRGRRDGRRPLRGDGALRRAGAARRARSADQRVLDPSGPGRLGHLDPVAAGRPRGDEAPGAGRGRHDRGRCSALAAPLFAHPPDRSECPGGPARPAVVRGEQVPRGRTTPARSSKVSR